jgi:hypothetical protein
MTTNLQLAQDLCADHPSRSITVDGSNRLYSVDWLVLVLLPLNLDTVSLHLVLMPSKCHVSLIRSNDSGARDATIVVKVLLDNVAVLLQDAVCVRVSGKVVDREEDVIIDGE